MCILERVSSSTSFSFKYRVAACELCTELRTVLARQSAARRWAFRKFCVHKFDHCFNYTITFYGFDAWLLEAIGFNLNVYVRNTGKAMNIWGGTDPSTDRPTDGKQTVRRTDASVFRNATHLAEFIYSISSCRWIWEIAFTLLICVKYNFDFWIFGTCILPNLQIYSPLIALKRVQRMFCIFGIRYWTALFRPRRVCALNFQISNLGCRRTDEDVVLRKCGCWQWTIWTHSALSEWHFWVSLCTFITLDKGHSSS